MSGAMPAASWSGHDSVQTASTPPSPERRTPGGGHLAGVEQQVPIDLTKNLPGVWIEQGDGRGEEPLLVLPGAGAAVGAVAQIGEGGGTGPQCNPAESCAYLPRGSETCMGSMGPLSLQPSSSGPSVGRSNLLLPGAIRAETAGRLRAPSFRGLRACQPTVTPDTVGGSHIRRRGVLPDPTSRALDHRHALKCWTCAIAAVIAQRTTVFHTSRGRSRPRPLPRLHHPEESSLGRRQKGASGGPWTESETDPKESP